MACLLNKAGRNRDWRPRGRLMAEQRAGGQQTARAAPSSLCLHRLGNPAHLFFSPADFISRPVSAQCACVTTSTTAIP